MRSIAAIVVLTPALFATPQSGGFQPGELVLYSGVLNGTGSGDGGVVRIDPVTGTVSPIAMLLGGSQTFSQDSVCYDPFRDRVLFVGGWPDSNSFSRLWAADAAGNMTDLGHLFVELASLTPGAGGRVYAHRPGQAVPIVYLDAANEIHPLLNESGTGPYQPFGFHARNMLYHAGLNALFVTSIADISWNCIPAFPNVRRIRLSEDGTRAVAVDGCAALVVSAFASTYPVSLSMGPGGQILAVADSNTNLAEPRMLLVDPYTMAVTPFAANGPYVSAAATNAGTWSHVLQKAVILDTFDDVLRTFAFGETGEGTVVLPSAPISAAANSGEIVTLIELDAQLCAGTIGTYCTAKTTTGGCVPVIDTDGCPSATAGSGFTVTAAQVPPGNLGIMLYGTRGPDTTPALGGVLCVKLPFRISGVQSAGGAGACGGQYSVDFNEWVHVSNDPLLVAGAVVHGQFWFRDPPASFGSGLSGGVTFTLAP
jgi:hypothetical protein